MLKRIIKVLGYIVGILFLLVAGFVLYVYFSPIDDPPVPPSMAALEWKVTEPDHGLLKIGNNWFRKSESGFYELYIEGDPFDRGVVNGRLTRELVEHQEEVFTAQLKRLVPSETYRNILKYGIKWFNRNLNHDTPKEYQLEIFGVSQSAGHQFDYIAPPYHRMLNYHAAHDIGHALQNYALVGCTSFATWGSRSEDSMLIVGRNFDFYLGDDFARDKILAFYRPSSGNKFMMVTFGGMTGVLSGMNDKGLTVTINAAKSGVPLSSATPVSLVAREILQYASSIAEAYDIAKRRQMFVSESFLIGSARDGKAVSIEKTPDNMDLYEGRDNHIVCTNHFLGDVLGPSELNQKHIETSASPYRFNRVEQLLTNNGKNSVQKTASILRNQQGLNDSNIGLGNEKSINQLVAHHAIIFQPEKLKVWISTAPWQLGKFVCYDLNKVFADSMKTNHEITEEDATIPADPFLRTRDYEAFRKYSPYRFPFTPHGPVNPDSIVNWNPTSYQAYLVAGDYWFGQKQYSKSIPLYEHALTLEIATIQEKEHIENNLRRSKNKIK